MKRIFTLFLVLTALFGSSAMAQCDANFNFTVNGATGNVQFLPVTTAAVQHQWIFGDGSASIDISPSHTYSPGTYNVVHVTVLRSGNDSSVQCIDSAVRTVTIAGQPACNLQAGFFVTYDSLYSNIVAFNNTSTGVTGNTQIRWDFGDGTSTTSINEYSTTHIYQQSGVYRVCFLAFRDSNCYSESCQTINVVVPNNTCNLVANFSSAADSSNPLLIHFTDESTPQITGVDSLFWSFGDGTFSTEKNPTHLYAQGGNYNVCLHIERNNGVLPCIRDYCQSVIVRQPQSCNIQASFNFFRDSVQTNQVYFVNLSAGSTPNTVFYWNFGDGSSSFDLNPVHTFATSGAYTVCLLARNDINCADTFCTTVQVQVPVNTCNIVVNFADSQLNNNTHYFINQTTPLATTDSVTWHFGDGAISHNPTAVQHTYTSSGTFNVCLVVTKNNSAGQPVCVREYCRQITVLPNTNCNLTPGFVYYRDTTSNPTFPNTYLFVNTSAPLTLADSSFWDFGDGSPVAINPNNPITHIYAPGTYIACLTVKKVQPGTINVICERQVCQTIIVDSPQVVCNLQAYFSYQADSAASNTIHFFNQSAPFAAGDSIRWTFGDGTSSLDANPSHTYTAAGTYTVCIRVKKRQIPPAAPCVSEYCRTITIQPAVCNLVANFIDSAVNNNTFYFINQSTPLAVGDSIRWTFGDGSTSSLVNPLHTYTQPGTYTVCLRVKKPGVNSTAPCVSEICHTVVVTPQSNPCDQLQLNFSSFADTINSHVIYFVNQSSPVTANTFSEWSFGDGDSSMAYSPVHVYAQAGTYTVCLRMHLGNACVKDSCTTITVLPGIVDTCNFQPGFTTQISTANQRRVLFTNTTVTPSSAFSAVWNFGDYTTSTGWNAEHTYVMPGWYLVCLTVTSANSNGCTRTICDSVFVPGNVIPPYTCDSFQLNFGYRQDDYMPNKFYFFPTGNAPVYNQQWLFTNLTTGRTDSVIQDNPVYVFADTGLYRVCVIAAFSSNCAKDHCDEVRVSSTSAPQQCMLTAYPNPAHDNVSYDVQLDVAGIIVSTVFNSQGMPMMQYTQTGVTGNNHVTLGIQNLAAGFYTVRVMYNGRVCYTRFQKL